MRQSGRSLFFLGGNPLSAVTGPRQLSYLQGNLEDLVGYEEDCSPQVLQVALRGHHRKFLLRRTPVA